MSASLREAALEPQLPRWPILPGKWDSEAVRLYALWGTVTAVWVYLPYRVQTPCGVQLPCWVLCLNCRVLWLTCGAHLPYGWCGSLIGCICFVGAVAALWGAVATLWGAPALWGATAPRSQHPTLATIGPCTSCPRVAVRSGCPRFSPEFRCVGCT